jgi:Holliday junction resolvase RusA-like endonuclease
MTRRDKWPPHRKCVAKYWKFKDELVTQCKEKGFVLSDKIYMEFHLPMPISWSKKKRVDLLGEPHFSKPDLDNMIKSVGDCLKKDDQTIHEITAKKFWSEESILVLKNSG